MIWALILTIIVITPAMISQYLGKKAKKKEPELTGIERLMFLGQEPDLDKTDLKNKQKETLLDAINLIVSRLENHNLFSNDNVNFNFTLDVDEPNYYFLSDTGIINLERKITKKKKINIEFIKSNFNKYLQVNLYNNKFITVYDGNNLTIQNEKYVEWFLENIDFVFNGVADYIEANINDLNKLNKSLYDTNIKLNTIKRLENKT